MTDPPLAAHAPAKVYGVELFYETLPGPNKDDLASILKKRSPDLVAVPQERETGPWIFEHQEHRVPPAGGAARALVAVSRQQPNLQTLEPGLKQSWGWPQASEVLPRCRGSILVTDLMAVGLHHLERLVLFQRVLVSVLEAYPCQAIHWQPAQQFIDPQQFLAAVKEAGGLVFTPGPLNVRLFRIVGEESEQVGSDGDIVMDTVGLAALGLPDLQCHFTGLAPEAVSRVLYNTGIYEFERGDMLQDGHTVPGIGPDDKWHCRRESSLALPERTVIDLDPGPPHSARERRTGE
jgi:hypothetical protein